jgi:hypothetical protein
MPKKSKNLGLSLFNREIQGRAKFDLPDYWRKRLEVDFGLKIENDTISSYELYQYYYEYYEFIKSAIEQLPALQPRDIRDFLCDKNIGQGKLQINLLKLMLTKPGAEQACAYLDRIGSSALEVALCKGNTKACDLIKSLLSEAQCRAFVPSLMQLMKHKNAPKYVYEFDGDINSLAESGDFSLLQSTLGYDNHQNEKLL